MHGPATCPVFRRCVSFLSVCVGACAVDAPAATGTACNLTSLALDRCHLGLEGIRAVAAALRAGGDKLVQLRIEEGGNKAEGACGDEGVTLLVQALQHKTEMLRKGTLVLSGLAVKTEGASDLAISRCLAAWLPGCRRARMC